MDDQYLAIFYQNQRTFFSNFLKRAGEVFLFSSSSYVPDDVLMWLFNIRSGHLKFWFEKVPSPAT